MSPALMVSCSDVAEVDTPIGGTSTSGEITVTAGTETRSVLNTDYSISWSPGDAIGIFRQSDSAAIKFSTTIEQTAALATFSGVHVDNEGDIYYSLYPYSESSSADYSSKKVSFELPSNISYTSSLEGSFANGANPAVAKVTGDLQGQNLNFKNICGAFQIGVSGSGVVMSEMVFTAKSSSNGDALLLAGGATIDMTNADSPVISVAAGGSESVTLDFGAEGFALSAASQNFTVMLPPMAKGAQITVSITLSSGVTVDDIVITDSDNAMIQRSSIYVVPYIYNVLSSGEVESTETTDISEITESSYPNSSLWMITSNAQPTATELERVAKAAYNRVTDKGLSLAITFNDIKVLVAGIDTAASTKATPEVTLEFPSVHTVRDNALASWINCNVTTISMESEYNLSVAETAFDAIDTQNCAMSFNIESNDLYIVPNWKGYEWLTINGGKVYNLEDLLDTGLFEDGSSPKGNPWVFQLSENTADNADRVYSGTGIMAALGNTTSEIRVHLQGKTTKKLADGFFYNKERTNLVAIDLSALEGSSDIPQNFAREMSGLAYLNLPATVTSIGNRAFNECAALAAVEYNGEAAPVLSDNPTNETRLLDVAALYGCSKLETLDLSWATEVGNVALQNCTSLTSVNLSSATSFGTTIFGYDRKLTTLDLSAAGDFTFPSDSNGSTLFADLYDYTQYISLTLNKDKSTGAATPSATSTTWLTSSNGETALPWFSIEFVSTYSSGSYDNEELTEKYK